MKYRFDPYELDSYNLTLSKNGRVLKVEPQIYALIELLVINAGETVTKSEIVEKVWQGRHISDAAISSRIHAARAIIGDDGTQQRLIKTVPNSGFRFIGELEHDTANDQKAPSPSPHSLRALSPAITAAFITAIGLSIYFSMRAPLSASPSLQSFDHSPNAAIFGHNTTRIWGLDIEACLTACLEERSFYCKSVDYTRVEKMCDLSEKSAEDVGGLKTDYPGSPHDHYARKNIDSEAAQALKAARPSKEQEDLELAIKLAETFLKDSADGSINLATQQYKVAASIDPDNPKALGGLIEAYRLQSVIGTMTDSEARPLIRSTLDRALALHSDNADIWTAAAAASVFEQNYEKAVEYADRGISHRHGHGARVHHYKSVALYRLGDTEGALNEHKEALFHDPDFPTLYRELAELQTLSMTANP